MAAGFTGGQPSYTRGMDMYAATAPGRYWGQAAASIGASMGQGIQQYAAAEKAKKEQDRMMGEEVKRLQKIAEGLGVPKGQASAMSMGELQGVVDAAAEQRTEQLHAQRMEQLAAQNELMRQQQQAQASLGAQLDRDLLLAQGQGTGVLAREPGEDLRLADEGYLRLLQAHAAGGRVTPDLVTQAIAPQGAAQSGIFGPQQIGRAMPVEGLEGYNVVPLGPNSSQLVAPREQRGNELYDVQLYDAYRTAAATGDFEKAQHLKRVVDKRAAGQPLDLRDLGMLAAINPEMAERAIALHEAASAPPVMQPAAAPPPPAPPHGQTDYASVEELKQAIVERKLTAQQAMEIARQKGWAQ